MRAQITFEEVLETAAYGLLASIVKIMPGNVTAYYPPVAGKSAPKVDVQPTVHDVRTDPELGVRVSEPWPLIPKVPVAFAKFGGYVVQGPVVAGDVVTLISFDLDPSVFRATGQPSDPVDTRRHAGSYWLALPFDITDCFATADPGSDLVIGQPSGSMIRINSAGVSLGNGATDHVGLASKIDQNFSDLKTFLAAIFTGGTSTALIAPSGTAGGPVTLGSAETVPTPQATGSTFVKTK